MLLLAAAGTAAAVSEISVAEEGRTPLPRKYLERTSHTPVCFTGVACCMIPAVCVRFVCMYIYGTSQSLVKEITYEPPGGMYVCTSTHVERHTTGIYTDCGTKYVFTVLI